MERFITADTHFGHSNIIGYCNRPFSDVKEMDGALIQNWNSVVGKGDVVYHLGDFAMGKKDFITNIVSRLNGEIHLIKGNHDSRSNKWYRECGFKEVYDMPVIFKKFWVLSHEPQPFIVNSKLPYVNIFGHVHNTPLFTRYGERHCCVCVERWQYTPVFFKTIAKHFVKSSQQTKEGE